MDNRPAIRNKDLLYPDESYKIVAACREVYKEFGGAFRESVVDNALTIALEKQGLTIESQKRINLFFQGIKVVTYVPDKVINCLILMEVKCKPFITAADEKQFWHYFKSTEYKLGFLVNFGPEKLEVRKRVYDLARTKTSH